jgi:hypothetical protein
MQTETSSPLNRLRMHWPWHLRPSSKAVSPVQFLRSQLDQQLTRAVVTWMVLLGIAFNVVSGLALWREVAVLHHYPTVALVNHVVGSTLTFCIGWVLLWLRHDRLAMAYIISSSSMLVFVQIWTIKDSTIFVFIGLTLVLPPIILPARTLLVILCGLRLGL